MTERVLFSYIVMQLFMVSLYYHLKMKCYTNQTGPLFCTLIIGCLGQYDHQLQHVGSKSYGMCLYSFVHYRFANTLPFYGIFINLQHFGSNIFLFQVVFGVLTASGRCLALLSLNHMGRRITQMLFMFLMGFSLLVNIFVPQGERRLDFGERKCLFHIF